MQTRTCMATAGAFASGIALIGFTTLALLTGSMYLWGSGPSVSVGGCNALNFRDDCLSKCGCGWCPHDINAGGYCYLAKYSRHCISEPEPFEVSDCSAWRQETLDERNMYSFVAMICAIVLSLNIAVIVKAERELAEKKLWRRGAQP